AKWSYQQHIDQQNGNDIVSLPRASVGSGVNGNGGGGGGLATSEASPSSCSTSNEETTNDPKQQMIMNNGSQNGGSSATSNTSKISSSTSSSNKTKPLVVTPEQVMKLYSYKLTPYEHREIFNYSELYFIGANAIKRMGIIGGTNNNDYDDEQGSYIFVPHDHI
ncbi:hypothetical protein BLA29_013026, partial [Euroglyphus maynei]